MLDELLQSGSGDEMHEFVTELYPICRSITGDGVRETLCRIAARIPLEIREVPSGTPVFDWTVPKEWNIREAWIRDPDGNKIVDFADHNLHVVGYSVPIHARMSLQELKPHLHSLPDRPDWIPYRTCYYDETWGFCLTDRQLASLRDGEYEVCVDSTLDEGSLTYGECLLEGKREEEVLLSAHVCHPSLANDNLSGVALLTRLGNALTSIDTGFSYRLIFAPGTIGSITWLARNQGRLSKISHGLIISCVGDSGRPRYKRSRRGTAAIDRAVEQVLGETAPEAIVEDFSPYGYDERQYCSPGFNLPVGLLERSKYGEFPEYHTSADKLEFIDATNLNSSYEIVAKIIDVIENVWKPVSTVQFCEPQLGKRGLYQAIGGDSQRAERQLAMLWVLNLADGQHTLEDIAARSGLDLAVIREISELLLEHDLLGH